MKPTTKDNAKPQRAWLWFFGLWLAGLTTALLASYTLKWVLSVF